MVAGDRGRLRWSGDRGYYIISDGEGNPDYPDTSFFDVLDTIPASQSYYIDIGAVGVVGENHYYLIQSLDSYDNKSGNSQAVGEFDSGTIDMK